jgi:hypothetical protein
MKKSSMIIMTPSLSSLQALKGLGLVPISLLLAEKMARP